MTIDADYVYKGLLCCNYLPMVTEHKDELPPTIFTTEDFIPEIADEMLASSFRKRDHDQIEYRVTRYNNITRLMHIPHPLPYARLCECIFKNWENLKYICDSKHSQIKPNIHGGGEEKDRIVIYYDYDGHPHEEYEQPEADRVVAMEKEPFPESELRQFELSCGARFLVDADIASFFPTIYTHAIPWALVGHEKAKANQTDKNIWYNVLDYCQRSMKRNETQGIPIGPATSNIISEVVLQEVDKALNEKGYKFVRYIDDYTCYCDTHDKAEIFLRDLEHELAKFLLSVNIRKISITELPVLCKASWVVDLNTHLSSDEYLSEQQVVNFIDYALGLQKKHLEGSVIKYAMRAVSGRINKNNINVYADYALTIAYYYPVVLPVVSRIIAKYTSEVKMDVMQKRLETNIKQHLAFRRSDAVCWSLYCAGLIDMPISQEMAGNIIESKDCMAMAMLLAMNQHKDMLINYVRSLSDKTDYDVDQFWILIHIFGDKLTDRQLVTYYNESGLRFLADKDIRFVDPSIFISEF